MLRTFRAALMMLLMWILMQAANAGFGQATVKTDKDNFMPFETMKIKGMVGNTGKLFRWYSTIHYLPTHRQEQYIQYGNQISPFYFLQYTFLNSLILFKT